MIASAQITNSEILTEGKTIEVFFFKSRLLFKKIASFMGKLLEN